MQIKDALTYGKKNLQNSSTPFLDSLILLETVTNLPKEKILISENFLRDDLFDKFCDMLHLRQKNMPIQYIINRAEFMGLNFFVDKNVLIPRRDTEILVETAINYIGHKKLNVIDLCTGSGCIAIALKKFCPQISISALDISSNAIDIAKKNSADNNVSINFLCRDIFQSYNIFNEFDVIISNPPYISSNQIDNLDENVKCFEPKSALDGGPDGLTFYKFIAQNINHKCKIFFEIGYDQSAAVSKILMQNKFININLIKDLANLDRVIYADKE